MAVRHSNGLSVGSGFHAAFLHNQRIRSRHHWQRLFRSGHELRVSEVVDFAASEILDYGYEVWLNGEKLHWYDPQPHPNGSFPGEHRPSPQACPA
jgi:hypothetical protein